MQTYSLKNAIHVWWLLIFYIIKGNVDTPEIFTYFNRSTLYNKIWQINFSLKKALKSPNIEFWEFDSKPQCWHVFNDLNRKINVYSFNLLDKTNPTIQDYTYKITNIDSNFRDNLDLIIYQRGDLYLNFKKVSLN